ncbi:MAG: RNA polymerase sigma factor [Bacteroidales bacterium]|jgi:RNA polymerase sigma-70 factor (ECF subfamily)|nr:RNA polymerase sigma factor [Bacteroidales bacterium]
MNSDLTVISRILVLGDKRAYETLVKKYQNPVYRFLLHLSNGNALLSEDIAQETFIKAYIKLGSFKSLSKFSTWLMGIAYNLYIDNIRKYKNEIICQAEQAENIPQMQTTSGQSAVDAEIDFQKALTVLSAEERAVTLLFHIEDMEIKKIAQSLSMPQGTVKSHLHRSKQKLQTFFKPNIPQKQ